MTGGGAQLRQGSRPVPLACRPDGQCNHAGIFHDYTDARAEACGELEVIFIHGGTKPFLADEVHMQLCHRLTFHSTSQRT